MARRTQVSHRAYRLRGLGRDADILCVAWVLTDGSKPTLNNVNLVVERETRNPKMPLMITYSPNEGSQWGTGIGQKAYVLRWTKLQLEPPSRLEALKRLKHTLQEARLLAFDVSASPDTVPIPHHLVCTAEHIVTDYLTHVAEAVYKDIREKKDTLTLDEFPIDLMITHPSLSSLQRSKCKTLLTFC